ncbi:hypothetical protein ACFB49_02470 [Sphingomonas sp. DBB INV C78]|uniref:hypothetical protein n=1 Tax=Sphingomonas sp. DBB INV C78 TaxID=3349434 RepID=UPI0036D32971
MIKHALLAITALLVLPACRASSPSESAPSPTATQGDTSEHTTKNGDTMGPETQSPPNKPDVPQNSSY